MGVKKATGLEHTRGWFTHQGLEQKFLVTRRIPRRHSTDAANDSLAFISDGRNENHEMRLSFP
jgi:hypothetical protein